MSVSRHHSGKCHHYVVQQLIVCQWPYRIYYHVAEYLVVDIAVQLFQQFRSHDFPYQTVVLCHLAKRKQFRILPNSLFSKVE